MSAEQSFLWSDRRGYLRLAGVLWLFTLVAGCRDRHLAGQKLEPVEVKTVTAYGVSLGPEASPRQVAFVLLRALRDDVLAARRKDRQAGKQAWATERSLAAPGRILANLSRLLERATMRVELSATEAVYKESKFWAPVVAHYVDCLDLTLEQAEARMYLLKDAAADVQHVLLDVENPADQSKATVKVSLAQEAGYWRVYRVGFNEVSVERLADRRTNVPAASRPARPLATTAPARPK